MRSSEKPSRVPRIPRIRREYLSRIYHSKFKKKKDKFANILNVCERCERKQKARRSLSAHPFLEAWRRRSGQPFIPYIIYKVDLSLSLSLSLPPYSLFSSTATIFQWINVNLCTIIQNAAYNFEALTRSPINRTSAR